MITRAGDTLTRCEQPSSTHRAGIQILLVHVEPDLSPAGTDKDTGEGEIK